MILICISFGKAHAEEYKEENHLSANVFALIWYKSSSTNTQGIKESPGIGLRYDISKNLYAEGNYFLVNPSGGNTQFITIGAHNEVARPFGFPLQLGIQISYSWYTIPINGLARLRYGDEISLKSPVPILTAEYGPKDWKALVMLLLPPNSHDRAVIAGVNFRF